MLTVDEALDAVRIRCAALPAEPRGLAAALGCVLAEDVAADLDLPPFDKALVDGYAVRSADLDGTAGDRRLRIVEEITAGRMPSRPLGAARGRGDHDRGPPARRRRCRGDGREDPSRW